MFPKWGWGIPIYLFLNKFYGHTYLYFAWSTGVCQALSVSVLATNRLSAILFPNEHRTMWGPKKIRIAFTIQFLPGLIMGLLTFFNIVQLFRNNNGGIVPNFMIDHLTKSYFALAGVLLLLVSIYLICSYCYLFWFLHKTGKRMRNSSHRRATMNVKKPEYKLFIMSSIIVTIQISILCLLVLYVTGILVLSLDEFYMLYNAVIDLNSGINPYLLWIFSDFIRSHILQRIGLKKKKNNMRFVSKSSMITVT